MRGPSASSKLARGLRGCIADLTILEGILTDSIGSSFLSPESNLSILARSLSASSVAFCKDSILSSISLCLTAKSLPKDLFIIPVAAPKGLPVTNPIAA